MLSEIGSNFWFSPNDIIGDPNNLGTPSLFGCNGSDYVWLSTGRSATRLVLKTILQRRPEINKVAVIPAFTCHTVIEPFVEFGFKTYTLPISLDLITTNEEIDCIIENTGASVLLVHRYFGFDTLPGFNGLVKEFKKKGVMIIEDCTQCLYSSFPKSDADFFVGSIRKWCGVPDGGFAVCKEGIFKDKPNIYDKALEDVKKEACELKYSYMFCRNDCKPKSKQKYREAEEILNAQTKIFKIGDLSAVIQSNLNLDELTRIRRRNYEYITSALHTIPGITLRFDSINDDVVPLYCPLFIEDRQIVQSYLADNDIYAPVIWPKADCSPQVCEMADVLYNHLLCIPIDQRYGLDDMQRIVKVLKYGNF